MVERSTVIQEVLDLFEAPSYLEIGVDQGETFRFLAAHEKVAVDPNFKFIPPPNTLEAQYFSVTSDEYFAGHCPDSKRFDVVYVDGLHTFEQTSRDMFNSLLRLRLGGIIIIDDVLPTTYHASLPDLGNAFKVRDHLAQFDTRLAADATWMGDVYKTAFFIEAFMQQLSYATVLENHGQLIVWSAVRPAASVGRCSMLDIATLSFADTILKRSVFNIKPLMEIIAELRIRPRSQIPIEAA